MINQSNIFETSSPARLNPYLRLAASMCKRAVFDLRSDDPITAVDALGFWLDDGPIWLDLVLDNDLPGGEVLRYALGAGDL